MTVHARRLTYFALITGGFVLLAGGIWLYTRHQLWLQGQRLDTLARVGLIIFGIFTVQHCFLCFSPRISVTSLCTSA
jgi:hypothetical protein